jgi:hypothetical protein
MNIVVLREFVDHALSPHMRFNSDLYGVCTQRAALGCYSGVTNTNFGSGAPSHSLILVSI